MKLIGPDVVNTVASWFKNFAMRGISESARLQFLAEAFNLPNRVNFAGHLTALSTTSRDIQFGLKFLW